ncbi:MAG: peptidoglycan-binding protein LysM [Methyloprofundus sp.]|nr:peptidoglycan-binding protein LysM [Methyloprofundus sp.]
MGLFDFAKNIGSKLFSTDADAAEKITAYLNANNPGIDGLNAIFKDGEATVIGTTTSVEAAQKVILLAGNIENVESVVSKIDIIDNDTDAGELLEPDNVEYYTIQSGDSLSKIAKHYYQNAMEYPRIFEANKEVIQDPDLIYPGQKIRIPLN